MHSPYSLSSLHSPYLPILSILELYSLSTLYSIPQAIDLKTFDYMGSPFQDNFHKGAVLW